MRSMAHARAPDADCRTLELDDTSGFFMAQTFEDKRFRSDFKAERDRVLKALRECEELDGHLTETLNDLRGSMRRDRTSASLTVRLTEQQIANRNQRLALIKELASLKKDVLDREFRLAKEAGDGADHRQGPTAATLHYFQSVLLEPGSALLILEPGDADEIIARRMGDPEGSPAVQNGEDAPPEVEFREGDLVSDTEGNVFVIGAEGLEGTGARATELFLDTGDDPAYAVLEDGRHVLVVEIT